MAIAAILLLGPTLHKALASPATYSGRATVVDATVLGIQTVLADTGPLPPSGGELNAFQLTANVPPLISAEALVATAVGEGFASHSEASIANLDLSVGSNAISASLIASSANAECTAAGPAVTGLSEVLALEVNSVPVTVTGEANQTIPITGGSLIINEQSSTVAGNAADIEVVAIHVIIGGIADVKIAVAEAGVTCVPTTGDGYTYGGRGTGVTVDVLGVTTHVADTGELPPEGGALHDTTAGASFPGILSTGTLEVSSVGQNGEAESRASVESLDLGILGNAISADVVNSMARATCEAGVPSVVGGSELVDLVILGVPITITGEANVTLPFGAGQVIINEQITDVTSTTAEITVNALHIIVPGIADVIIAHSRAYIECPAVTSTATATATAVGPTATATATAVGPTSTATRTATATAVGPTSTATRTATATAVGPTSTATATGGACQVTAPTHAQTVAGGSSGSATVTSPSLAAGTSSSLYLASISSKPNRSVTSVSGLGLTWTLVKTQCSGRSQTMIEVWKAQGAGSAGPVSATFSSAPTNAVIEVSRYTGASGTGAVVSANTLGVNGMCTGGTDDNDYQVNLITSSCNSVVFGGASMRNRTHTPGGGYTERAEFMQGSSGDAASLAVTDKLVPVASSTSVEGTFSGSVDWAIIGIEIVGSPGGPTATATPVGPTATATAVPGATAECKLYAVHDESGNDSQFFKVDLPSEQVTAIGPVHNNHDLEGLDIHPTTRVLYSTAGSSNQLGQDGFLFTVDAGTGALTVKGDTTFSEVVALSFRPTASTLWGWSEGAGLILINQNTGTATLVFNSTLDIEGMAWDNAGDYLYLSEEQKLYRYDPVAGTLTLQATNLPGETEALETRTDDNLWGGLHKAGSVSIFVYDPATNQTIDSEDISTQYNDVEGIAWPEACPLP